jgi:vancomycin resistance protein YoaR
MNTVQTPTRENYAWLKQVLLSVLLGIGLVVLVLTVMLISNNARNSGKILNGVSINGTNLGGLTLQQAAAVIGRKIDFPLTSQITVQYGDKTWTATPAELGLYLDVNASAQAAFDLGRSGGMLERLAQQLSISRYGRPISPTFIYDQNRSQQFLQNIASQIDKPAVEASITLNRTEVGLTNGQAGQTLDMSASLAALSAQMQTMQSGTVQLAVQIVQPLVLDASPAADQARQILSQPLTLTIPAGQPGDPAVIDPANLAGMLVFERMQDGNGGKINVNVDEIALRGYLIELATKLRQTAQNTRFVFNDDTKLLEVVQPAVIGRELNIDNTIADIKTALAAGQHSTDIAFDVTKPAVTDDMTGAQLGITELLHMEVSYFHGSSAERVQNITIASKKFYGLLVAPGATFSMSDALGDVSLDNGYAEALIILGDQTIQGVGGGVCQVSTTLFRTAFFSGLPITERHAHAYRVKYYEQTVSGHNADLAGLDATVFVPLVDLKFVNDSPYWLLMETYVYSGSQKLVWKFYSTSDGRTVDWTTTGPTNLVDPPEDVYHENDTLAKDEINQTDWAVQGADVTVNRTVYKNGNVYFTDTYVTHYEAWPNGYDYGPGTQIPPPDSSIPTD